MCVANATTTCRFNNIKRRRSLWTYMFRLARTVTSLYNGFVCIVCIVFVIGIVCIMCIVRIMCIVCIMCMVHPIHHSVHASFALDTHCLYVGLHQVRRHVSLSNSDWCVRGVIPIMRFACHGPIAHNDHVTISWNDRLLTFKKIRRVSQTFGSLLEITSQWLRKRKTEEIGISFEYLRITCLI